MAFSIIAAVGKKLELGKNGKLLWHLPGDLAFFKKMTSGHPILMGRKTFESLPGVLPGRKHYVVTHGTSLGDIHDSSLVCLVDNLESFAKKHKDDKDVIFVIGGGMIYQEMLSFVEDIYLTEVDASDEEADTFFPKFDKDKFDREVLGKGEDNGIGYSFIHYARK